MEMQSYILPPEQLERLREAGGPLADRETYPTLDTLKDMAVAVVEVDGQIVAYWVTWYALHAEPLYIAEPARKHPAVARLLIEQVRDVLARSGELSAFATIEEENLPVVGAYAGRLGFHRAPGALFYLVLPAQEPVKE